MHARKITSLFVAVAGSIIWFSSALCQGSQPALVPGSKVSIADFGAFANDEKNDMAALRRAMGFAKDHPGITLYFPPGIYNWRDEDAVRLMDRAMTGEFGDNPEPTIFMAYYPYARGLDFRGISGLTIEASGATLLFEGWMEPISLDQADDITLRGLTIDYKRRAYSSGPVIAAGDGYIDVRIEDQYPINARMPVPRIMLWDRKAQRMIGETYAQKFEIIAPQTVRLHISKTLQGSQKYESGLVQTYVDATRLQSVVGSQAGLMHSMHFRPAILIHQADNIRLENVTIYSQPGMGVVGHRSSNITLSGMRIVPAPGAVFSVTTDATHFTSITGLLRIENSVFEGHGDDTTNIHNYYWSVARTANEDRYSLTLPVNAHAGVLDYPDIGARLEVLRASSLEPIGSVIVTSVTPNIEKMQVEVGLQGDLPGVLDQYFLSDVTRLPKVELVGNTVLSCRCRGALIKTRNVLIEGNRYFNAGTAVHVAAEASWREGVTSANVVIRNNHFANNGYIGAFHEASAITVDIETKAKTETPLHRGILIEGNTIVGTETGPGAARCIFASHVDGLTIRNNQLSRCRTPISTEHSEHVAIHDNTVVTNPVLPATPVQQSGMEARHAYKVAQAWRHRYDMLMIGDSITHGLEGPAFATVWEQFYAPRNTLNLGYSGARTENILWNLLDGELTHQSPKVVTLLIGTNNSDDANYPVVSSAEQIATDTGAIIDLLRERLPDTKILLLRIFPRANVYRKQDGSERGSVQQRTATNRRAGELVASLADNQHVFYLDVNSVFLRPDGSIDPQLMPDLLHPSPTGALAWARAMEPQLAKLFGDTPRGGEVLSTNK